ncbi:MAG: hypothetical protein IGS39_19795 [Calothrix sp. C42_A2020_038]|nr:hypothetical protein [Calothrix sp. C42_A2020_038]
MINTIIHSVICKQEAILTVFCIEPKGWQFRVISSGGAVYGEDKFYCTQVAAEKAARKWLK